MGWKAFNLIATNAEEGYLTTYPSPDAARAREFLRRLGGTFQRKGESTFEKGLYPKDEMELYIGAFAGAFVIGSIPIAEEAFLGRVPHAVLCANEMLPGCRVLIVTLHSVVDLFGYAWYENGKLLRARAGSAEDGVFYDRGPLLPIEDKLKAFDETIDGEELVMELCRPFLGCRMDQYNAWDLKLELFRGAFRGSARSWWNIGVR